MSYINEAAFDTLRSVAGSAVTGSYAAIGSALTLPAVVLTFKNQTDGDVLVSTGGVNNNLVFPSNSFGVYDVRTNAPSSLNYMFAEGVQFYVKAGTSAPTSGNFYIEAVIAQKVTS